MRLLLSALVVVVNNVIVFGLWFWEIDDGGPIAQSAISIVAVVLVTARAVNVLGS